MKKIVAITIVLLTIVSCNNFRHSASDTIQQADLKTEIVASATFNHVLYINNVRKKGRLHVYIGGDGSPWVNGLTIAKDPTSNNPLALRLLSIDKQAAVYLGRPCYHGLFEEKQCHKERWTSDRYSQEVITSMHHVISQLNTDKNETDIVLFGYSGGAVIASLLANELPNVIGLVTIAGNLDTRLWTKSRGFLPLTGSLNPVDIRVMRSDILQIHLIGNKDRIVPNAVTKSFLSVHGGLLWQYQNFDHRCCWEKEWPIILEKINALVNTHSSKK